MQAATDQRRHDSYPAVELRVAHARVRTQPCQNLVTTILVHGGDDQAQSHEPSQDAGVDGACDLAGLVGSLQADHDPRPLRGADSVLGRGLRRRGSGDGAAREQRQEG